MRLKTYLKDCCLEKGKNMGNTYQCPAMKPMSAQVLAQAEKEILKIVQREEFSKEIQVLKELKADSPTSRQHRRHIKRTCRFQRLDPFLDKEGIMRVGGRLKEAEMSFEGKHPILLPKKSHLTKLIVRHCHENVAHQGRGMTINEVRASGYWILGCSSVVSNCISKCVTCRHLRRSPQVQKMADLPKDRFTPNPPFSYCGMDCFGPWLIKEGRKEVKKYGIVFTCMSSRAVHIETLNSLSTDAFINALRRFIAVRGPVRQLRCDRGTNFVGAEAEFKKALNEMNHDLVKSHLLKEGCDYIKFNFNPPAASHMGGEYGNGRFAQSVESWKRYFNSMVDS
nr:uncharacterized protein LOC129282657 [Lytechinus pictus]